MPTVSKDQLKQYIKTYFTIYLSLSKKYLPEEIAKKLYKRSLLPCKITGYISTQFGVGFLYEKSDNSSIEIINGSKRIEELLLSTPNRVNKLKTMLSIEGKDTGIAKLTLEGGFPFRLTKPSSNVTLENVRFMALGWQRDIDFAEIFGERDSKFWTLIQAEKRATEVILEAVADYQIAQKQNLEISNYIDYAKRKNVLILGSYSINGKQKLLKIASYIKSKGYYPILVDGLPHNPYQNLPQKVVTLGSLARFVIIEDTEPAGQIMEVKIAESNDWVTIILREEGRGSTYMTAGVSATSKVITELWYVDDDFISVLNEGVLWVESKLLELKKHFDCTFPWRKNVN